MARRRLTIAAPGALTHQELFLDGLAPVAAAFGALVLAWLVTHEHVGLAAAAAIAAPTMLALGRFREGGLILGLVLVVLLPPDLLPATSKVSVLRLGALLVAAALFLDFYRSPRVQRLSSIDGWVLGFAAVGLVGWAIGAKQPHSSAFAINYFLPLFFYAGARRFASRGADRLLVVLFVASSLAALSVLYEALVVHRPLFADPTSYYWNATNTFNFRPGGVFGSPPTAATVLGMSLLAGLPVLSRARGVARVGAFACFGISLLALILTFTRVPIAGFAVGVLLYLLLLGPKTRARTIYLGTIAVIVTVVFVIPQIQATGWFQKGVLRQGTLASRQIVWRQIPSLVRNSPVHEAFGYGVNSLEVGTSWLPGQPQPDIGAVPGLLAGGAQNQYLRTAVEGGLVGLAVLLVWWLGTLASGIRASFRSTPYRREIAAAAAGCIATVCSAFDLDVLRQPQTFVVFALLCGLTVGLAGDRAAGEQEETVLGQ